jgi:hypothetical protein
MAVQILAKDEQYVLNHCTKYLARDNTDPRHNFGQFRDDDLRSRLCESWRFPVIDSYSDGVNFEASFWYNAVTFVYPHYTLPLPQSVAVIATFANLFEPIPLRRIGETPFYALTVVVPKGEVHTYKFIVDDQPILDPVNPQQVILDNGRLWSRFFTHMCTQPISFERWEAALLGRITDHILPFQTEEGDQFLKRYYDSLDLQSKDEQLPHAYRLDEPVGVVNFIDKLVAKEENHRLIDYKICLSIIDKVVRQRDPYEEPVRMPRETFMALYQEMATDNVAGWDYDKYHSPLFFLGLLRRHTFTGAFSHLKYGGNIGAAGWAYLEERFRDSQTGKTMFDWRRIMEKPLGGSPDYHG